MAAWGWGVETGSDMNGHEVSFWGVGNIVKLDWSDGCTIL